MKHFGAFEAKTHFSEILSHVMKGEKFIITKHGIQVAMIVPFSEGKDVHPTINAINTLKKLRKGTTLGKKLSIRKMRGAGRK